jgi:hypothetical protein
MRLLHLAALESQLSLLVPRVNLQDPESTDIILAHLVHPRVIDLHATNVAVKCVTRPHFHALTLEVESEMVFQQIRTLGTRLLVGFGAPFRKAARHYYSLSNASTCAFVQIEATAVAKLVVATGSGTASPGAHQIDFIVRRGMITVWESLNTSASLRYIVFAPHPSVAAQPVSFAMSRANDVVHNIVTQLLYSNFS